LGVVSGLPAERGGSGASEAECRGGAGAVERGGWRRVRVFERGERAGGGEQPVRLDLSLQPRDARVRTDDDRPAYLSGGCSGLCAEEKCCDAGDRGRRRGRAAQVPTRRVVRIVAPQGGPERGDLDVP